MSSQEAVLRFLRDPASYPEGAGAPEIHSTHGSWVFLAGDLADKPKKEIDLGWMDYSTPEKRRRSSALGAGRAKVGACASHEHREVWTSAIC